MSISVQCPACQHAFAVADRFAGKKGKCPKCGMIFTAQAKPAEEEIEVFPVVPSTPARSPAGIPAAPVPKGLAARKEKPRAAAPPSDSSAGDMFASAGSLPGPTAVQAGPVFPVPREHGEVRKVRRARRSPLPLMIGGSVGGLALLGIAIGVIWSLQKADDANAVATSAAPEVAAPGDATASPPTVAPPPATVATDLSALAPLRKQVLTLEIKSAAGTAKASCFLVRAGGLAAAPWHLLAQATSVEAVTADDVRIAVGGTVAIDAGKDLAIIKLVPTLPVPLDPLPLLTQEMPVNSDIVGIDTAHTAPVIPGKFKSTDAFVRLSPSIRAKLKGVMNEWDDEVGIILHAVKLSADSLGAPLVTPAGEVVGMHIAADGAGGLAVHARHITELLATSSEDVQPFAPATVASIDPPAPLAPAVAPTPDVSPAPAADPIDALIERIQELQAECEQHQWTASDPTEYASFQLFAKFVNDAANGADTSDVPAMVKQKLDAAVQEALTSLTAEKWPDEAAWAKTNEQAANGLKTPNQGVFTLTRMVFPTSQGNKLGDVPVAIVEVVGQSQRIGLLFKTEGEKFPAGAQLLVIGVHDQTQSFKMADSDVLVPLVRTKYVLAVQPQD